MNTTTALYSRSSEQFSGTIIEKGSGKLILIREVSQLQKVIVNLTRHRVRVSTRLKAGRSTLQMIRKRIYVQRHESRPSLNPLNPLSCRK